MNQIDRIPLWWLGLGALVRVVLPLVQGGLWACTVFTGIAVWNEYLFALMLTTSGGLRTWPVGLQLMVGEFQLPWGALSAGGILSVLPVLILFSIVQRAMVPGLAAGAVNGWRPGDEAANLLLDVRRFAEASAQCRC